MCYHSITYDEMRARYFEAYSLQVLFLITCITSRIASLFPNKNSLRNSGGKENLTSYHNLELKVLPRWLSGKESARQCRRCRLDPWAGKIPGEENGNPLQYSFLGNPTDRGVWQATVRGVAKSWP